MAGTGIWRALKEGTTSIPDIPAATNISTERAFLHM
jgi:hypothetical protein